MISRLFSRLIRKKLKRLVRKRKIVCAMRRRWSWLKKLTRRKSVRLALMICAELSAKFTWRCWTHCGCNIWKICNICVREFTGEVLDSVTLWWNIDQNLRSCLRVCRLISAMKFWQRYLIFIKPTLQSVNLKTTNMTPS